MKNDIPKDFKVVRRPPAGYRARPMTEETRKYLNTKRGHRVGPQPSDEREHFIKCPTCGQAIDMRNLGDAFYHDERDHEPLPVPNKAEPRPDH